MSLITHTELLSMIRDGIIENADERQVNGSSLDLRFGPKIMVEVDPGWQAGKVVDLRARQSLCMREFIMGEEGVLIPPGGCFLAHSMEVFNLPDTISAQFQTKSSVGRIFLDHMLAGWCDPTWHDSVLTMEFKNMTQYHHIRIRPGDAVGQLIFHRGEAVPREASYAMRGRYNKDRDVSEIKP